MKRRLTGLIGLGASIVASIVLFTSAPALADTVTKSRYTEGDLTFYTCVAWVYGECVTGGVASATFQQDGDHLYVWDDDADGWSAVVQYWRSDTGGVGGQLNEAWNHYGAGHRIDHNMNIPESGWIEYRVCEGKWSSGQHGSIPDPKSDWCTEWIREPADIF
jgi:hypothetical protein